MEDGPYFDPVRCGHCGAPRHRYQTCRPCSKKYRDRAAPEPRISWPPTDEEYAICRRCGTPRPYGKHCRICGEGKVGRRLRRQEMAAEEIGGLRGGA